MCATDLYVCDKCGSTEIEILKDMVADKKELFVSCKSCKSDFLLLFIGHELNKFVSKHND